MKAQLEKDLEDGIVQKPGFGCSSIRPCLSIENQDEVGPGKYKVNLSYDGDNEDDPSKSKNKPKDIKSVFISTAPRFNDIMGMTGFNSTKSNANYSKIDGIKTSKRRTISRKISQIRALKQNELENILKKEKSKESSVFRSKAERFITPRPLRLEDLSKEDYKKYAYYASLMDQHKKNLMMTSEGVSFNGKNESPSFMATISKSIPFDCHAPRFSSGNTNIKALSPGPGSYEKGRIKNEQDLYTALCEADGIKLDKSLSKLSPAFKSEERSKNSVIDKFIKEKSHVHGPGAYNTNTSTFKKKTFNYELA